MNELLAQLSAAPHMIDSYGQDEIEVARQALADFTAAVKAGEVEVDSAGIAEATALAGLLSARETTLVQEAEARAAEIAALDEALGISPEAVEETVDEVIEEAVQEIIEETETVEVEEPEVVQASVSIGHLANLVPIERKPRPDPEPDVLIASGGRNEGKGLTPTEYGDMALRQWRYSSGKHVIASVPALEHKYAVKPGDDAHNSAVFSAIAQDAAVDVIMASGGRCAPAENVYGFFNIATRAGILALPSVNAPRGAINLPVSPSLGDILGQSGIATEWTDENDSSESPSPATKPVYVFECPEFQECEVAAWPTILQFGNFAARFYPEAIANVTSLAMVAAERTVNAARLAFMTLAATAGNVTDVGGGTLINLTTNLASNAADYRATYGMGFDAVLDVAIPHWVRDAAYADSISRDSTNGSALNAWLGAIFSELNLRPQFVYDLDDQTNGTFENLANVLMWAPGTVVELDGGTLDLGVVRDSTLNSTNNYQTFVEPFVGWCVPGHEIRSLAIEVCPTGATGDRVDLQCSAVS